MRGQSEPPTPPRVEPMKTGSVFLSESFMSVTASRYSPQAATKLTMMTTTMPFLISGNTIPTACESNSRRRCGRSRSSSVGTVWKTPRMMKIEIATLSAV